MNKENETRPEPGEPSVWANIARIVLLVVVLVAAWFVLEWLMSGK